MNDIYNFDFMKLLPTSLKKDKNIYALAYIISKQLNKNFTYANKVIIYPIIDKLPEKLLDILSVDLNVYWYDYEYDISIKRKLIKNSIKTHKKIGTKYAVESQIKTIFSDNFYITEWFEYGGSPFYFKINVKNGYLNNTEEHKLLIDIVDKTKNARSHIDNITFTQNYNNELFFGIGIKTVKRRRLANV